MTKQRDEDGCLTEEEGDRMTKQGAGVHEYLANMP